MDNDTLPQYIQIALSIARRIAGGDVPEGAKISGRSKLSSEYNVSPETIRKAVRLLGDMRVVDVREQSGVYVLSADNAKRYLHDFEPKLDVFNKRRHLTELLEQQSHISHQLADLCRSILDYAVLPVQADDTLPNYIFRIPEGWNGNGRNLGELHFWQATGATIVAIRCGTSRIVSPGPCAELYGGDEIIFVGSDEAREAVSRFFFNTE